MCVATVESGQRRKVREVRDKAGLFGEFGNKSIGPYIEGVCYQNTIPIP